MRSRKRYHRYLRKISAGLNPVRSRIPAIALPVSPDLSSGRYFESSVTTARFLLTCLALRPVLLAPRAIVFTTAIANVTPMKPTIPSSGYPAIGLLCTKFLALPTTVVVAAVVIADPSTTAPDPSAMSIVSASSKASVPSATSVEASWADSGTPSGSSLALTRPPARPRRGRVVEPIRPDTRIEHNVSGSAHEQPLRGHERRERWGGCDDMGRKGRPSVPLARGRLVATDV